MNEEWGTPVSRDKIIYRRNRLIEYQKVGEVKFTPLYETIDENILDINYMIYEIDKLQSNWNSLRELIEDKKTRLAKECSHTYEDSLGKTKYVNEDIFNELDKILDKMNELEGKDKRKE